MAIWRMWILGRTVLIHDCMLRDLLLENLVGMTRLYADKTLAHHNPNGLTLKQLERKVAMTRTSIWSPELYGGYMNLSTIIITL